MRAFRYSLYITAAFFVSQQIATGSTIQPAERAPHRKALKKSPPLPNERSALKAASPRQQTTTASEQYIVTGTRDAHRTARSSSSPISIITSTELVRTGAMNVSDALSRTDPSINSSITSGSGVVAGLRMRGLSPNEVLVLVDGKRRHTTGVVATYSGPEHGATPVDLNTIPVSAIDHIEVLRDGATAMYGSDAIAGVVNIILKKKPSGLNMTFQTGAHPFSYLYKSPGWDYQLSADGSVGFSGNGYLHVSGQVYHADHYVTGTHYRPEDYNFGLPEETRESMAIEAGRDITESVKSYMNITYMHRHIQNYMTNRLPSVLPQVYPYGFNPSVVNEENDYAATLGLTGDTLLGSFHWDLSTTYGADESKLSTINSANLLYYATYGSTPTKGFTSGYRNAQWTNNLDISRSFKVLSRTLKLAFGAEHRLETYDIASGNEPTYIMGGFQGAPGLTPQSAGNWSRDVWAGYVDVLISPIDRLDLDFAGRFEHYTDFGNSESGKISARYEFSQRIAFRSTISNGFRAPTLAEQHFSSLSVTPTGAAGSLAVASDAARLLGASPLKPERSTNVSGGIVFEPLPRLHVTADAYQINIRDRIVGGGNYSGAVAEQAISLTGIDLPPDLDPRNVSANYFSNGASTRTQGVDINIDYMTRFGRFGKVGWSAGIDLNRTRLHHLSNDTNNQPLLNAQAIGWLTTSVPRSKIILNARWTVDEWDVNLRQTRYGQTTGNMTYQIAAPADIRYSIEQFAAFENKPRWMTDLEVTRHFLSHRLHVTLGVNNLFNVRPRKLPLILRYNGNSIYDTSSSGIPISGSYYYGRIGFSL
ncbi:TonB-dependent receptor [Acetobacter senegalensis]|uniref:TonB-dependent receptor plug domain-containing protein n=1 Tax=Acetobacter senegalensis TaxID=446692 RepID=UPI00209D607A|nr:TonB-dependent receptor [Acetobacter senegalensis]MCP1197752.1 TonB-dependent receptor [Acetobacter senegalensis]